MSQISKMDKFWESGFYAGVVTLWLGILGIILAAFGWVGFWLIVALVGAAMATIYLYLQQQWEVEEYTEPDVDWPEGFFDDDGGNHFK